MIDGCKETSFGLIPKSWDINYLGKICDVRDGTHDSPKYHDTGIPFITSKNLTETELCFENIKFISKEDHLNFSKRSHVENGDILFGMIGTVGKPIIVNEDFEFSIKNVALLKFSKSKKLNNFYALNVLKSSIVDSQFKKMSNGGVLKFVALGNIRNLIFPLPPLAEQQKIAEILSTVDDKIEVINQQITETQELKKGLMQRLLTKGIGHTEFKDSPLGKIPKCWEVIQIQELLDKGRITSHLDGNHGGLYPNADEFINEGVPYIGANSFLNSKVDFSKCKHLSMERSLKFRKGVAKNGDVLFAHNATVGPVAFLETALDFVILSTTATYYRLDNKTIDAKYWLFFLSSPTFKNQYEKVMGQSTRNQVPITMQRSFYSVLPPFKEQKEISEILNIADEKLEILLEKKTRYQELKQGLMQQLLTGKIRVKV